MDHSSRDVSEGGSEGLAESTSSKVGVEHFLLVGQVDEVIVAYHTIKYFKRPLPLHQKFVITGG